MDGIPFSPVSVHLPTPSPPHFFTVISVDFQDGDEVKSMCSV